MPDSIYVDSVSPCETLQCIVEGDGRTVWMYLHDLEKRKVIGDAPVCSLVEPLSLKEFQKTYRGKGAPPLVKEYASAAATIADLDSRMIRLKWADDAVVAMIKRKPVAMIVRATKRGHSRAIAKEGPWGHPWDQRKYDELFG